eukprot:TRINITY_DN33482_c0_g1_i1.p1 TRINITY_DN33482_c0_g1~~TRINITY_DN33482_c0_g1_i1.p1  ORF type:complete len:546 (+),score=162.71 TRINITY_DN33482_c0_g1_i1:157-1794(+)
MGCGSSATKDGRPKEATKKEKDLTPLPNQHRGEDIRDKYVLGKILGSGSFGQVREATMKEHPDEEVRAVKMIERDDDNEDGEWSNKAIFVREVGLLQQIKHDHIIRYYDFYEDVHFLYVVMELCKGGEVFTKILELKRFSEKNAASLGKQMLKAIEYIHQLKIAHRDIKAENFMLADNNVHGNVKMIDFGMATRFEDDQVLTELCGSPHYLAPELIGQKYDYKADVWAFGVLLYLLMYGHYPYDAKHPRDIMVKILTEQIRWQTKAKLSQNGLEFLKRCLEHAPKKRVNANEALSHPWLRLADSLQDTELLPAEVIRSAHKKVTATRKQIDPKIDEVRNKKLNRINEDFDKGIRYGKRLGETPKEEFMSKPEFVRRENKITTAPSHNLDQRRGSIKNMLNAVLNKGGASPGNKLNMVSPVPEENSAGGETTPADAAVPTLGMPKATTKAAGSNRLNGRAASVSGIPQRLSYIGLLSGDEESNLKSLYEEKRKLSNDPTKVKEENKEVPGQLKEDTIAETEDKDTDDEDEAADKADKPSAEATEQS